MLTHPDTAEDLGNPVQLVVFIALCVLKRDYPANVEKTTLIKQAVVATLLKAKTQIERKDKWIS